MHRKGEKNVLKERYSGVENLPITLGTNKNIFSSMICVELIVLALSGRMTDSQGYGFIWICTYYSLSPQIMSTAVGVVFHYTLFMVSPLPQSRTQFNITERVIRIIRGWVRDSLVPRPRDEATSSSEGLGSRKDLLSYHKLQIDLLSQHNLQIELQNDLLL